MELSRFFSYFFFHSWLSPQQEFPLIICGRGTQARNEMSRDVVSVDSVKDRRPVF